MKLNSNKLTRFSRVIKVGTTLGAALLAASALQAQTPNQTPSPDQNPQAPVQGQTQSPNPGPGQGSYAQNPSASPQTPSTANPTPNTVAPGTDVEATGKISHRGKEFIEDAAQANQAEIALANVAEQKSQNSDVKALSQMLITDHQQNLAQVQSLAQAHGVTLDGSLSWMNQHEVNRLQKADPGDFDKEYSKLMLKDHVQCIKKFDKAVADVQEPDVKQYAQNTLPALRNHLRKSAQAARAAGVDQSTISGYMKELPNDEPERGVTVNNP